MPDPQQIGDAINQVVSRLNSDELEPSPRRSNWAAQRESVRAVIQLLEREVLEPLDATLEPLSQDDRESLRFVAGSVGGAAAAMLLAAGDRSGFSSLLSRAVAAAGSTDARNELEAATRDADCFVLLAHARWLRRRGKTGRADGLLRRVSEASREPVLREISQAIRRAPSPIKSAPSLFTLNGCGVSLHGSRDKSPDGSHVATTYVTLVFIPLLPLASYRVVPQGNRSYLFLGRVPVWKPLQYYRWALVAAALVGLAALAVDAWRESPTHRYAIALEKAQAAEKAGRASEAIADYSEVLATFESNVDAEALAWISTAADLPKFEC